MDWTQHKRKMIYLQEKNDTAEGLGLWLLELASVKQGKDRETGDNSQ